MTVRLRDGEIPYTWWVGIEITENHVINLLLREANNLIHVDENNKVYVDLQLEDGIEPDDDFPVGVTTWKILQEDWWQQNWLILNWKTTSWDYARLIYAVDWNVYIDIGDWQWILLGGSSIITNLWNCKAFFITDLSETTEWQKVVDWYLAWKYPIVVYNGVSYILEGKPSWTQIRFYSVHPTVTHLLNNWYSYVALKDLYVIWDANNEFQRWMEDQIIVSPQVLATNIDYTTLYTPQYPWSPTTKKYVDDGLATKQDVLTPWTRITITVDPQTWDTVISADVSGVMTYMWNVSSVSDLANIQNPSQWDCWYVEWSHTMYAWDGSQWNDIGGTWIDLTNYFNKQTDDSDDIIQWSTHLFVTTQEKNVWNNKQDQIVAWNNITINADWKTINATVPTAWSNISITNNQINNDAPFEPENIGTMWQFLQKTNTGYKWINPSFVTSVNGNIWNVNVEEFLPENSWATWQFLQKTATWYDWVSAVLNYTPWTWININNWLISNTLPFNPWNAGTTGQVLRRTSNGYEWSNESWWGGWWGWTSYTAGDGINISGNIISNSKPFEPSAWWSTWDILTKTANWYKWGWLPSGKNNVKFWSLSSNSYSRAVTQEIYEWLEANTNNWAIINDTYTNDVFIFYGFNSSDSAVFYGTKRNSDIHERKVGWESHWYFTKAWQWELDIYDSTANYGINVWENPDDMTHTNYLSALGANYPSAFMPTDWTQPATKAYVDAAIQGWWTPYTAWTWINITNNVISNTWVISETVSSGDSGTSYVIKVSNSDPASWTANNIITFVL